VLSVQSLNCRSPGGGRHGRVHLGPPWRAVTWSSIALIRSNPSGNHPCRTINLCLAGTLAVATVRSRFVNIAGPADGHDGQGSSQRHPSELGTRAFPPGPLASWSPGSRHCLSGKKERSSRRSNNWSDSPRRHTRPSATSSCRSRPKSLCRSPTFGPSATSSSVRQVPICSTRCISVSSARTGTGTMRESIKNRLSRSSAPSPQGLMLLIVQPR